jgi:hypothetical protein
MGVDIYSVARTPARAWPDWAALTAMGRFDPLSDLDFEELVADLLRAETKLPFRAGVRGRDRGIDVLAIRNRKRHVGQCKHVRTGDVRRVLREAEREAEKLAKRNPRWASYRFITSMRLSHDRRDEITEILSPWIAEAEHVLGEGDLNRLLREHPDVEARHVKLWLGSLGTLRRALHAGAYERSEALLEETRAVLPRYVQTEAFLEARTTLHEHGVVVIAGPPGDGKTTLARLLMLDGLEQDYEPYDIAQGGLSEAWDLVVPGQRQLFFYDDFLGRISLASGQEDDQVLMRFMRRVARSKTTRMVLTTREYVLRQAQLLSEVLERESSDLHRFLLHVDRYDRREKARIFYNHIYFSDQVNLTARRALLKGRAYRRIVDHDNYSPRLIEWMTGLAGEGLDEHARRNYAEHCLAVLNNPEHLWQRAFDAGLNEADRVLLLCMASLPEGVTLDALETAFLAACTARGVPAHGHRFQASLKVLDDSFVSTQRHGSTTIVEPHNPSLLDFLTDYVRTSQADAKLLLAGAVYIEQVLWAWRILSASAAGKAARRSSPPAALMPAFSRAFEATLDSPVLEDVPRLSRMHTATRLASRTGRLALLLDHLDHSVSLADVITEDWLEGHASDWVDGPLAEDPSVEGLALVQRLAHHGAVDAAAVVTRLKPKLLAMPEARTRWQCIAHGHDLAPSAFDDQEWSALQEAMSNALDQMLEEAAGYFGDVSELEDFASAATLMGIPVNDVAVDTAIEDIEIAVAEREAEAAHDYEPDYDPEDFRDLRGGGQDDADIDAMFQRLAD